VAREGHRLFAALYDRANAALERKWMGERREALLSAVRGEVLEIGGGTGANLPYYRDVERLTISEPDPFMRGKLWPKLGAASISAEISDAGAESLPFPDDAFDAVISTLVLCTVPDQRAALREVRRVLRPGGRLLFIEHVRGEGRAARWQDRVTPLWRRMFAGCHPNRDTVASIEAAGFRLDALQRFLPPVPLSALTPHVQGAATPRSSP
jgi:ubiquinone/menaquinone biosynthesis C-methylase UbiE